MKAEICWALESLLSNYSFNSCSTKTELFEAMFIDSTIAKQFSVGKTKCAYYLTYGMAPYFKGCFLQSLKEVPLYAESFDESYNNVLRQGQMYLQVRYWNSEKERVDVHYSNSSFMGKLVAVDLLRKKILQVFSDGPNINLSYLKILNEHRRDAQLNPLIDIGTGYIPYIIRLKNGEKESNWNVKKLSNAMFKLFDESPSRHADYKRSLLHGNLIFASFLFSQMG